MSFSHTQFICPAPLAPPHTLINSKISVELHTVHVKIYYIVKVTLSFKGTFKKTFLKKANIYFVAIFLNFRGFCPPPPKKMHLANVFVFNFPTYLLGHCL